MVEMGQRTLQAPRFVGGATVLNGGLLVEGPTTPTYAGHANQEWPIRICDMDQADRLLVCSPAKTPTKQYYWGVSSFLANAGGGDVDCFHACHRNEGAGGSGLFVGDNTAKAGSTGKLEGVISKMILNADVDCQAVIAMVKQDVAATSGETIALHAYAYGDQEPKIGLLIAGDGSQVFSNAIVTRDTSQNDVFVLNKAGRIIWGSGTDDIMLKVNATELQIRNKTDTSDRNLQCDVIQPYSSVDIRAGYIQMAEISKPENPAENKVRIYPKLKDGGLTGLYALFQDGTEVEIASEA